MGRGSQQGAAQVGDGPPRTGVARARPQLNIVSEQSVEADTGALKRLAGQAAHSYPEQIVAALQAASHDKPYEQRPVWERHAEIRLGRPEVKGGDRVLFRLGQFDYLGNHELMYTGSRVYEVAGQELAEFIRQAEAGESASFSDRSWYPSFVPYEAP